jgi:hypothetical protein
VRWCLFVTSFFVLTAACFFDYLWLYRVEFAQVALTRSFPDHTVTIGAIDAPNPFTLEISDVDIETPDGEPLIVAPFVALTATPSSWLSWLLIPSTTPLHIQTMTIETDDPIPPLPFTVDYVEYACE